MSLLAGIVLIAVVGAALAWQTAPRQPQHLWALGLAALTQVVSIFGIRHPALGILAVVALCFWGYVNRTIPGVPLVVLGSVMNLSTMISHGGAMPVHAHTLAGLGLDLAPGTAVLGTKDVVVDASPLWILSDWIVVPIPGWIVVASPGDFVVGCGILWWLLTSRHVSVEVAHDPAS